MKKVNPYCTTLNFIVIPVRLFMVFLTGQDMRAVPLFLLLVFIKRKSPSNCYWFICVLEMTIAEKKKVDMQQNRMKHLVKVAVAF